MRDSRAGRRWTLLIISIALCCVTVNVHAAAVFVRCRVIAPDTGELQLTLGGYRHKEPWQLPSTTLKATAGQWSEWFDASHWPLDEKMNRAGGIAEWPAMRIKVARETKPASIHGCAIDVELADAPSEKGVIHHFTEQSESDTIAFLLPTPLREHAAEFETGSQMTARQLKWAREATNDQPVQLKDFTFVTALWGHYDPALARQAIQTLKLLGFNVIGNYDPAELRKAGMRTYATIWNYDASTQAMDNAWDQTIGRALANKTPEQRKDAAAQLDHYVLADEVQTLDFRNTDLAELNSNFRNYLRSQHVNDQQLPKTIDQIEYPAKAMFDPALSRDADLPTRRLLYYAAKFGHFWSAHQLRYSADLIHHALPGIQVETLPSDHGFFNAWGPPHIGMSYRMLDLFELGAQRSIDQLSAEDWLGLNHMYGPQYTWTGAQSFEYFTAICRCAIDDAPPDHPMMLRGLVTVSDDKYLRLKAFSALGQGAKSFFFWTFGPTYIGTENYWSDCRSEYDGIAKLGRAIQQIEPVLCPAHPVRDPVAILYSVSHDIWHSDSPAAFVEKRLLWHALRHLHIQPDFLREEDIQAGRLKNYKVLYVTDWCISRAASAQIDRWIKDGGVAYLSAGAATRDEFYEPYVPPFATHLWPPDAAQHLKVESHQYNERVDLPGIKPMTTVEIQANPAEPPFTLPVLGCRLPLRPATSDQSIARFADHSPAGQIFPYGHGTVIGLGFLPMLAYGQAAGFKPTTLEERWPDAPRKLIQLALGAAHVTPIAQCNRPVVETSLLSGSKGSVLLLANYTYHPIDDLVIDLRLDQPINRVSSVAGVPVQFQKTQQGVRLQLPLDWTDALLIQ